MGITARLLMASLVLAACGDDGGGDGSSTSGTAGTGDATNATDAGPGPNTSPDDDGNDTPATGDNDDTTTADDNSTNDDGDTTAADSADSDSTTDDSTGSTGSPLGDCDGIPVIASGVGSVYMEVETIEATADWVEESNEEAYPGFTGSYFQWNDTFGSAPGEGETALQYCFAVETEGTYWLETHGRRDQDPGTFCETSENDGCNDVWVQIDGQGSGDQTWTKKMQSGPFGQWQWDDRWDPQNGAPFRTELELSAGVHLLGIAGRSHRVKLDAIRIFLAETEPPTR